jgi:deoxyribose-phosphate aldolase
MSCARIRQPVVDPLCVETAGLELTDRIGGDGFPSSQTVMKARQVEVGMAVEQGADEVDIVLNVSHFMAGNDAEAGEAIRPLKETAGEDTTVKVILETGLLKTRGLIRRASLLAVLAGPISAKPRREKK